MIIITCTPTKNNRRYMMKKTRPISSTKWKWWCTSIISSSITSITWRVRSITKHIKWWFEHVQFTERAISISKHSRWCRVRPTHMLLAAFYTSNTWRKWPRPRRKKLIIFTSKESLVVWYMDLMASVQLASLNHQVLRIMVPNQKCLMATTHVTSPTNQH